MGSIMLAGFLKWETPGGDVRLCDGGTFIYDGERYSGSDSTFGTIASFETITEGVGDEIPAGSLTFTPAADAAPADINSPLLQGSRLRMWVGEIDSETGLISGTPDLQSDSIVDVTRLKIGTTSRDLEVDFVSRGQRLLLLNDGNVLSGEAHRRVYPDETGLNNAVGVPTQVAWGVASAPRGTVTGGGSGGGGGGGGGYRVVYD